MNDLPTLPAVDPVALREKGAWLAEKRGLVFSGELAFARDYLSLMVYPNAARISELTRMFDGEQFRDALFTEVQACFLRKLRAAGLLVPLDPQEQA